MGRAISNYTPARANSLIESVSVVPPWVLATSSRTSSRIVIRAHHDEEPLDVGVAVDLSTKKRTLDHRQHDVAEHAELAPSAGSMLPTDS